MTEPEETDVTGRRGISRRLFAVPFLLAVVGCSDGPAFHAPAADVTGAVIEDRTKDPPVKTRLTAADARAVYAALQADEADILEAVAGWDAIYVVTFETRGGDKIAAYLEEWLLLWMPAREPHEGDREVPETVRTILSRYVRPRQ